MKEKLKNLVTIVYFNIGVNIIGLPLFYKHEIIFKSVFVEGQKSKFIGNQKNNFKR